MEPLTVRWMNTLRRSASSVLRRARLSSLNRLTARVMAGFDTFRDWASPRTMCGGGVR